MGKRKEASSYTVDDGEPIDIPQDFEKPEQLDNPLRIIILLNAEQDSNDDNKSVTTDDLTERVMDYVQTMEEVDEFFNEFDENVAIPNDGHIKYEVGSDGLVVILVDSDSLRNEVLNFIDDFNEKLLQADDEQPKRKK